MRPSATKIAVCSRSGAPVPLNSRAPVSQSRPRAGAGAAISAGNLCVTSKLPPATRPARPARGIPTRLYPTSPPRARLEPRARARSPARNPGSCVVTARGRAVTTHDDDPGLPSQPKYGTAGAEGFGVTRGLALAGSVAGAVGAHADLDASAAGMFAVA